MKKWFKKWFKTIFQGVPWGRTRISEGKREFFGMKYPFDECARAELFKLGRCLDCSVRIFCKAPEKLFLKK